MHKIAFFNNKGGVGKTTMVYHMAYMFAELGYRVLAADLDPQSNLTSMFLPIERIAETLEENSELTIMDAITPIVEGEVYGKVHIEKIEDKIGLLIGSLSLSMYEDKFSDTWLKCLDGDPYSFKVTSSIKTIFDDATKAFNADFLLVDVGPNLGALNRATLIAVDSVILPVASDLFSLQGIKNLGKTLFQWRKDWEKRLEEYRKDRSLIPKGIMQPRGYVVMQYTAKDRRPVKAYLNFANQIPHYYRKYVTGEIEGESLKNVEADANCLGLLKHYHSLAPMAMEANKPMFLLKPSDGAIGAHVQAVRKSYADFKLVAKQIIDACDQRKNALTDEQLNEPTV